MTNYAAWDSFDVDHALDEVDQLHAVEEFASKADDILKRRERESLEATVNATRKAADALRSKAAVAALKNKRSGNRRKIPPNDLSVNEVHGSASYENLADTAVSLALELSTAMDKINKDLTSLLEKVDLLKTSIKLSTTRRCTPLDLRNGFNFLNNVQQFTKVRSKMDSIIARINAFNSRIEILYMLPSNPDPEISNSAEFSTYDKQRPGSQEMHTARSENKNIDENRFPRGESLKITSTITILEIVDESLKNMMLFASRYISTVAVPMGEFSVGCDVSRYHLKLLEVLQDQRGSKEEGRRTSGGRNGGSTTLTGDAMVWVLRGLALAGIGSGYLANIHFRRVKQMQPDYPNIDALLDHLDRHEMRHAARLGSESLETSVIAELLRIESRYGCMCQPSDNLFDISTSTGVSVLQIDRFLGEGGVTYHTRPVGSDLHMEEREDDVARSAGSISLGSTGDFTSCSSRTFEDGATPPICPKQAPTVEEIISTIVDLQPLNLTVKTENRFEAMLSQNLLLKLARRTFYEGQLLFLERLLYSAEIKYIAAYVLVTAALKHHKTFNRDADLGPSDPVRSYVLSVQSAGLVNAALCRSHRSAKKSEGSTVEATDSSLDSSSSRSARQLLEGDCSLSTQVKLLCNMDTQGLLDACVCGPDSLLLRSRRVSVTEKTHRFADGLAELDLMEALVSRSVSRTSMLSSDAHVCDQVNPEGIISSIAGAFELFGFKVNEFSQQNLFCEIISPLISLERVFNNSQSENSFVESTRTEPSQSLAHQFSLNIIQQIKNKRSKLLFLKKKFGC